MVAIVSCEPGVIGSAPTVARLIAATSTLVVVAAKRASVPVPQLRKGLAPLKPSTIGCIITPLRKYDLHRESSGIPDVLAVEETLDHIGLPLATAQV